MAKRLPVSWRGLSIVVLFAIFVMGIMLFSRDRPRNRPTIRKPRPPRAVAVARLAHRDGLRRGDNRPLAFDLPADAAVLFVYPGVEDFTSPEADRLHDWVETGGVLILVGVADPQLQERFAFAMTEPDVFSATGLARQAQPLLPDGPAAWYGPGPAPLPQASDAAIPVLALPADAPAVTVQQQGAASSG
ncbi:MAG: DUF4350 domain-containing protein [Caldilineaceae bacterium]